ncbi:thymidylate kinase [Glutamicibacter arilaitensis]|uniref:thymidylate kinase n=1 Tax=Glutamicibacter arilaitensis TaxID=256701 RepID=UPI00384C5799
MPIAPAVDAPAETSSQTLIILGMDGAGKTTTIRELVRTLELRGQTAQGLANPAGRRWLSRAALGLGITVPLMIQDKIETMIRIGNIALNTARIAQFSGVTVMDRHLFCQLALRGIRQLPHGRILPWMARKSVQQAQVVVLDVDVRTAHSRIVARGEDSETYAYLHASRAEYLRLAAANGWPVVDATQSTTRVVNELLALVEK